MNWGHLFFKFSGRINRGKFWIAVLVYAAIYVVLAIVGYVTDDSAIYQAINGMLSIVIFISSLAVGVKRLHDRNKSGWYLVLFYVVPGILLIGRHRDRHGHGGFHRDRQRPRARGLRHRRLGLRRAGLPARHHRRQPVRTRSARADGHAAGADAGLSRRIDASGARPDKAAA